MALDGLYLHCLVQELNSKILNGRVEKVNQPEKDEIILSIKNERKTYKLLISASSVYPKIHLATGSKQNPLAAPMYCMVLRKYLSGARVVNVRQLGFDRIVFLDFESSDDLGFHSIYTLTVEIMGRHSNITLVRDRDKIIMDSIKHITPDVNSVRCLYPGIQYVLPPSSKKLDPSDYSYEDFESHMVQNSISMDKTVFSKAFTGVSTQFSKELSFELEQKNIDISFSNLPAMNDVFQNAMQDIRNEKHDFTTYVSNGAVKDFYFREMNALCHLDAKHYDSPSEQLQDYYFEKDKTDRLTNRSADLTKLLNVNIERCEKKIQILKDTLIQCEIKDELKIHGELLTANIYSLKIGMKEASLCNYYSENGEMVTIPLDPNKTPSENIQACFKKYNKLKKSEEAAKVQIEHAEKELDYLQSVLTNVRNAEDYEGIDEIKRELIETGYIKFKKSKGKDKKVKSSKPLHFTSKDGLDIYIGKNNIQNDYLTLKFADKRDIWMHTKNIPGSHVIIKSNGNVPDTTLEEAAGLAAYYSKAKDSVKVAVDYTEVKNVHKPSGSKPGMVIYYTNKTVYVDPLKPESQQ